jgi:hypothetical protein
MQYIMMLGLATLLNTVLSFQARLSVIKSDIIVHFPKSNLILFSKMKSKTAFRRNSLLDSSLNPENSMSSLDGLGQDNTDNYNRNFEISSDIYLMLIGFGIGEFFSQIICVLVSI